jgi:hypothetical protein
VNAHPPAPAAVAELDVDVHDARQRDEPAGVEHLCAAGAELAPNGLDDAVGDRDVGLLHARGGRDARAADEQVGHADARSAAASRTCVLNMRGARIPDRVGDRGPHLGAVDYGVLVVPFVEPVACS